MQNSYRVAALLIGLLPILGCAKSGEDLIKDRIDQMNRLADAIASDAEDSELRSIQEDLSLSTALWATIPNDEKQRLGEEYGKEVVAASASLTQAVMKKAGARMPPGMMRSMQKQMRR